MFTPATEPSPSAQPAPTAAMPTALAAESSEATHVALWGRKTARRSEKFLLTAFVYEGRKKLEVEQLARAIDAKARQRAATALDVDVHHGDRLDLELQLAGATVDEPSRSRVWRGETLSEGFIIEIPDSAPNVLIAKLLVLQNAVPIGRILFNIAITSHVLRPKPDEQQGQAHRFRYAFISYASPDRGEVLRRVQMLEVFKIRYFQDLLSLDPGDRWQRELYRSIDKADVFLLFWSTAARNSEWVGKEIAYAIARQGGNENARPQILPVIIEGPPPPEPPSELKARLHFNSKVLQFLSATEAERQ